MPLETAIDNIEQLKDRPALAQLLAWRPEVVQAAKWDRSELTIWLNRGALCEALAVLRDDPATQFAFLCDVTAVDWYPAEPRFEVVYHVLSMKLKQRVRIKVKLSGADASIDSVTPMWPGANPFEREVFDLFGIRFTGHPYLRRIMMPADWEGHPLRKDYPVEGYR
ncbi:MAG TPA: NADH-quinone oxidoreductase subunit C [Clostridia bacterium]|nr:NADH-quinone oxidoreductase subunit C [Clostridia bacterium]